MHLFLLIVILGGAFVVAALIKLSQSSTSSHAPREGLGGSEFDVWGRPRDRKARETRNEPRAMGASRLLS